MPENIYVSTTAAAIRGSLLQGSAVEKLAECTTLDELVNRLKATHYGEVLSKLSPPYTSRGLELAFRERLADVHYRLGKLSQDRPLISVYYLRQIAWDLKTGLKAKALSRAGEESMGYLTMHAEELVGRRDLIVKMVAARDLAEVPALLAGTEFSSDVATAVSLYSARKEIRVFDLYLDHSVLSRIASEYADNAALYSTTRAIDVAGVKEMVELDVDSYNILSVLRAKLWRLPEEEVRALTVTSGPDPRPSFLNALVATDSLPEAFKLVGVAYPRAVPPQGTDEEAVDAIETYFTVQSSQVARKAFVWQGLGIATALALTKLLEFEVRNLAAVAIGVEARMDPKTVVSRLVP